MSGRAARFLSIELAYGSHRRRFEFPRGARPTLVVGPNGAGKSTLLEALARTLYGFNRRSPEERERLDARRPWEGETFRATVALETSEEVLVITRDFESDEVIVRRAGGGPELFHGEAKPVEARESHRRYRELLARRFGLDDLGAFEMTACVRQGALGTTRIGDDLLRIAAGGHAAVDAARGALLDGHHRLTREPIAGKASGKRAAREWEELRRRIETDRAALREARAAEAKRRPLVEEGRRERGTLERLDREIAVLEAALGPLAERRALEAARGASVDRRRRLDDVAEALSAALGAVDAARAAAEEAVREGEYPADFEARSGALRWLWEERSRLAAEADQARRRAQSPGPAWGAAALAGGALLAAAGLAAFGPAGRVGASALFAGGAVLALAGGGALARARRARRAAAERLRGLEEEAGSRATAIADHLRGVPEAGTLTPDTLPDRLRRFRRQVEARRDLEAGRRELADGVARARSALLDAGTPRGGPAPAEDRPGAAADEPLRLHAALAEEQRRQAAEAAKLEVRLEASRSRELELPEGVRPDAAAVEAALVSRRRERTRAAERVRTLEVAAATDGRPLESPIAIERRLAEATSRLSEVEREILAHRHAWRLLADAYEEFRASDQKRLLDCISAHLAALADGALGPLESENGLESTRLRAFDRRLPLACPPLSHGQLHAALLAVRLGSVDFLAGSGIQLPLLVDEPFAHLDPARAAEAWRLLVRVARDRQVIVATQDVLILERLRVEPDLSLPEPVQREFDFGGGFSPGPSASPA